MKSPVPSTVALRPVTPEVVPLWSKLTMVSAEAVPAKRARIAKRFVSVLMMLVLL